MRKMIVPSFLLISSYELNLQGRQNSIHYVAYKVMRERKILFFSENAVTVAKVPVFWT